MVFIQLAHTPTYTHSLHLLVRESQRMRSVSRSYVSNFTAAITYDRDDKRVGPRTIFNLTGIKRVHYSERLNYHSQHFQSYG